MVDDSLRIFYEIGYTELFSSFFKITKFLQLWSEKLRQNDSMLFAFLFQWTRHTWLKVSNMGLEKNIWSILGDKI